MAKSEDEKFMSLAIKQAQKARALDEVPVGAVIVQGGKVIARACNKRSTNNDPTAHAEILALRKAGKKLGHWNLEGCEIYVTKEPCVMCAGAMVLSRMKKIHFGAFDKRFGCSGSVLNLSDSEIFNHRAKAEGGLCEEECAKLLTDFFKEKRKT